MYMPLAGPFIRPNRLLPCIPKHLFYRGAAPGGFVMCQEKAGTSRASSLPTSGDVALSDHNRSAYLGIRLLQGGSGHAPYHIMPPRSPCHLDYVHISLPRLRRRYSISFNDTARRIAIHEKRNGGCHQKMGAPQSAVKEKRSDTPEGSQNNNSGRPYATNEEWARNRSIITHLYQDETRTLEDVMAVMAKKHNFCATYVRPSAA
jgi:hypothetical protein